MTDRPAKQPIRDNVLEWMFFSRPSRVPSNPIDSQKLDVYLERSRYWLIVGAIFFGLAAFYGPEFLAYKSHINEPGIHTATKFSWTLFLVAVFMVGTAVAYWIAIFRAKRNRLLAECLILNFPDSEAWIKDVLERHHGLLRLAILAAIVSGSIVVGAAFVQKSSLWWDAPLLHAPLGFTHLTGVFFFAGYFLLRSLAVNRIMRFLLENEIPPSVQLHKYDESDLYTQLGHHYLMMTSFALFAATYLAVVWVGLQLESGEFTASFGFASAITLTVAPGYFVLTYLLVFRPMLRQRRLLDDWKKRRLRSLGEKIDQLIGRKRDYNSSELSQLATYKIAYDALESSFPTWPMHPNQARIVLGIPTTVLFPIFGLIVRAAAAQLF